MMILESVKRRKCGSPHARMRLAPSHVQEISDRLGLEEITRSIEFANALLTTRRFALAP